jgi:hypothetical protein
MTRKIKTRSQAALANATNGEHEGKGSDQGKEGGSKRNDAVLSRVPRRMTDDRLMISATRDFEEVIYRFK